MAHNLDSANGQHAFVSARVDAWHRLGTVLPDAFDAHSALKYGGLADWNLRKQPTWTTDLDGTVHQMPGRYAIMRDNPFEDGRVDVLGNVGEKYTIVHNEELVGFLDTLVDESGAHFETAGAIDGGKRVFVTMKLPGHIKVGGVDRIDNYIAAMTSHDGSTATQIMVTPVRIVCQNTLNLAMNNHSTSFKVRHTSGITKVLLQQARESLEFTFDYLDEFQAEAERLINTTLTTDRFEEIITKEFGAARDAKMIAVTKAEERIQQMMGLFADSYTHEGLRETAWAGLNALTEWHDHFVPVRPGAGATLEDELATRSRKALLDPAWKDSARKLILANA